MEGRDVLKVDRKVRKCCELFRQWHEMCTKPLFSGQIGDSIDQKLKWHRQIERAIFKEISNFLLPNFSPSKGKNYAIPCHILRSFFLCQ